MRQIALLLLVSSAVISRPAQASCVTANCLCQSEDGVEVVQVVTARPQGTSSTGRILAVHGNVATDAVGDTVSFDVFQRTVAAGERHLVAVYEGSREADASSPGPTVRSELGPIDGSNNVVCTGADPEFKIALDDATTIALSLTCSEQTAALGFREPPCNDTGCGCGSSGPAGIALVALSRRRRRAAPEASCVT